MRSEVTIDRATLDDLDGIMQLQMENQPERGGNLAASFTQSQISQMIENRPLIIARRNGQVIAFLMNSDQNMNQSAPIVQAMFRAYKANPKAYVYGPICVQEEERGNGLAQAMFNTLRSFEPGRECVLFIRRDNRASLRAHEKMGMHQKAEFSFAGVDYVVLSFIG